MEWKLDLHTHSAASHDGRMTVEQIVAEARRKGLNGVAITDHNVRETLHIVDRAYILNEGRILLEGSANEIADSPIAKKFYLGDNFKL